MQKYLIIIVCIILLTVLAAVIQKPIRMATSPLLRLKKRRVMTDNEIEFFHRIKEALPEHHIFPQVSMSAILEATMSGKESLAVRNRIDRKRIDFGIFDINFDLVCIVELDDKTHKRTRDEARDKLPQSAGITTIRWMSKNKPAPDEIRTEVLKLKTNLS